MIFSPNDKGFMSDVHRNIKSFLSHERRQKLIRRIFSVSSLYNPGMCLWTLAVIIFLKKLHRKFPLPSCLIPTPYNPSALKLH